MSQEEEERAMGTYDPDTRPSRRSLLEKVRDASRNISNATATQRGWKQAPDVFHELLADSGFGGVAEEIERKSEDLGEATGMQRSTWLQSVFTTEELERARRLGNLFWDIASVPGNLIANPVRWAWETASSGEIPMYGDVAMPWLSKTRKDEMHRGEVIYPSFTFGNEYEQAQADAREAQRIIHIYDIEGLDPELTPERDTVQAISELVSLALGGAASLEVAPYLKTAAAVGVPLYLSYRGYKGMREGRSDIADEISEQTEVLADTATRDKTFTDYSSMEKKDASPVVVEDATSKEEVDNSPNQDDSLVKDLSAKEERQAWNAYLRSLGGSPGRVSRGEVLPEVEHGPIRGTGAGSTCPLGTRPVVTETGAVMCVPIKE
jgi:hypothetical protein